MTRRIRPEEIFEGEKVALRLVTPADCTERYVAWLADPEVNRWLETRWTPVSLESIRSFVESMSRTEENYLFSILDRSDGAHVGNIKIGPIHPRHAHADVSFFIGERSRWGRGLVRSAITVAARIAFDRLDLHRLQAGVYQENIGSCRALERAGFRLEGILRQKLRSDSGWQDHLWYGLLREEWGRHC